MALAVAFQHHVVGHAHRADQTHAQTILGHKGQVDARLADGLGAFADELHGCGSVGRVILDACAALGGLQTGNGLQQLLLAVAGDARNAEDFAAVDREGRIVQHGDALGAADGQMFNVQPLDRVDRLGAFNVQLDLLADHHLGQLSLVGVLCGDVADILALAQDGDTVTDGQDLVQLVGDDDDRLAVGLHVADDAEQLLGLLRGQNCRRLVEDQDVRAAVQHLDDLQRLLLADAHLVDLLVEVKGELVLFADGAGLVVDLFQVELLAAAHRQGDILRRGEHVHELEVLVDHADAQVQRVAGGADGRRLVADIDLALVGEVDTGDHVHQGRLAAAIFAQQGQNLAAAHAQGNILVGHDGAKGLGDVLQAHSIFVLRHCAGSFQESSW